MSLLELGRNSYARLISTYPKHCLIFIVFIILLSGFIAKDIQIDNNFAALFATDNDEMAFRHIYRQEFSADDNQLIAIVERKNISESALVTLIEDISDRVKEISGLERVLSATEISVIWSDSNNIYLDRLFGSDVKTDKTFAERLELLTSSSFGGNLLASKDGQYFLVIGEMFAVLNNLEKIETPAMEFRRQIESIVEPAGGQVKLYFAGLPYTRIAVIESMQNDLIKSSQITVVIVAFLLFVIFRHWLFVALPLISIGAGVSMTATVIRLNGDDLNQMTIIYPVLLMVVSIANSIHLLHRFLKEYELSEDLEHAVVISSTKIAKVSFLTAITTATGFASMLIAEMQILYSFGLYLAVGVIISFIILCLFIPAGLMVFYRPRQTPIQNKKGLTGNKLVCPNIFKKCLSTTNVIPIFGLGICLLGWSLWQSQDAQYDYSMSKMLNKDSDIALGNQLMDTKLSGTMPIEISFKSPHKNAFKEPQNLQRVYQFGEWLQQSYPITAPVSLAGMVQELNRAFSGKQGLPESSDAIAQLLLIAESAPDAPIEQIANFDFSHIRMRSSIADYGSQYVVALKQAIDSKAQEIFDRTPIQVQMTGEAPAGYRGMNMLAEELIQSVLVALVVIVVTIGIFFRSPAIAVASVFPNALPIMIGLGIYSLTGEKLNPLPGVAFCIAIGIAVDDTVHLLARYREQISNNYAPHQAMLSALQQVTPALLHTSIILVSGFLAFTFSEFQWNQQLGLLGASLVILAFISDIIFTPATVILFSKIRRLNRAY